jgi:D-lactate dehydrogenase (cytochrome)
LTHLFTGSEGTLGLVTAATLKLAPIPEHFSAVLASFQTTNEAAAAVFGIIGSGLNPAALELLDAATIVYMNMDEGVNLPIAPTLLMEFHGATPATLQAELAMVRAICDECGAERFEAGVGREERDRLWAGRHHLGEILFRAHPGYIYLITDVAVPISRYPELAGYTNGLIETMQLKGALFGHAGDGNLHTVVFCPADEPDSRAGLQQFNDLVVQKALRLDGTSTGEHGVGIGKQKYLVHEYGEAAVEVMQQLKNTLDPNNILNPGKIVGS